MSRFVFPRWANKTRDLAGIVLGGAPLYLIGAIWYGFSPKTIDAGYMPKQPVPYSHALHAGELGIDCRYCHNTVEQAAHAAIPPTATCMNCHARVRKTSAKLEPIRQSAETGDAVEWIKVHDLPDYVYFNHSAHVTRGVGCVSCHGRVDKMPEVFQQEPLSMGWCLDCHRAPEQHLRPPSEVTNMGYKPEGGDQLAVGMRLRKENNINPPTDCSTCHR
ncbi:MAG: cytochrome c3 family protein [Polyangiaceae bacterium]|nr:cytochrome c3 family protein [Polyangiaceae bacterium]